MSQPSDDRMWLRVLLTYPCARCGAQQGDMCTTASGNVAPIPHAARTRDLQRCPHCYQRLPADALPGDYCAHCALVRSLIVERYTPAPRHEP